jgi:hypothetical protein
VQAHCLLTCFFNYFQADDLFFQASLRIQKIQSLSKPTGKATLLTIVLKPGPTGRLRAGIGSGFKKIEEVKTRGDLTDLMG